MDRGPTSVCLLACATCGLAVGCSDAVLEPIRRVAASTTAEDGGRERDAGRSDRDSGLDPAHCDPALSWPEPFADAERQLLDRIDELRADRVECGDRDFRDLPPLRRAPELQCSARLHSLDMVQRDFQGRTNPDGEDPDDRMRAAGFDERESSESIVVGETDPEAVLEQLLSDWDDCMNVASDELNEVGIGRHEDRWTLDFARD